MGKKQPIKGKQLPHEKVYVPTKDQPSKQVTEVNERNTNVTRGKHTLIDDFKDDDNTVHNDVTNATNGLFFGS